MLVAELHHSGPLLRQEVGTQPSVGLPVGADVHAVVELDFLIGRVRRVVQVGEALFEIVADAVGHVVGGPNPGGCVGERGESGLDGGTVGQPPFGDLVVVLWQP